MNSNMLNMLMELSFEPFVAIDIDDKILVWNTAAQEVFGWRQDDVIGTSLSEFFVPPAYREIHIALLEAFRQDQSVFNDTLENMKKFFAGMPTEVLHKNGKEIVIVLNPSPIKLDDGTWMFCAFIRVFADKVNVIEESRS